MQYRYAYRKGLVDTAFTDHDYRYFVWRLSVLPLTGIAAIAVAALARPIFAGIAFMLIPFAYRLIKAKFSKIELANDQSDAQPE
ncbi:MAG: hypothetical protein ABI878_06875 [Acidobacteriota bacterium]